MTIVIWILIRSRTVVTDNGRACEQVSIYSKVHGERPQVLLHMYFPSLMDKHEEAHQSCEVDNQATMSVWA